MGCSAGLHEVGQAGLGVAGVGLGRLGFGAFCTSPKTGLRLNPKLPFCTSPQPRAWLPQLPSGGAPPLDRL